MKNKIVFALAFAGSLYVFFNVFNDNSPIKYSWLTQKHITEAAKLLEPVLPEMEDYFFNNRKKYPNNLKEIGFPNFENLTNNKFVKKIFVQHQSIVIQLKDLDSDKKTYFSLRPQIVVQPLGLRWICNIGKINPQFFESTFPDCIPPKVTPYSHLMEMVAYGVPSEVRKMVSKGADINKILDSNAPLYQAIKSKNQGIVKLLLSLGANIELKNNDDFGRTPLMYAVLKEHIGIIKILVKNGANVNVLDSEGESVLDYVDRDNKEIEDYLIENGAEGKI